MQAYDSLSLLGMKLKGAKFKSLRHANDIVWTVICYERNGYWTCQEPDHNTTCQFSQDEIVSGSTYDGSGI